MIKSNHQLSIVLLQSQKQNDIVQFDEFSSNCMSPSNHDQQFDILGIEQQQSNSSDEEIHTIKQEQKEQLIQEIQSQKEQKSREQPIVVSLQTSRECPQVFQMFNPVNFNAAIDIKYPVDSGFLAECTIVKETSGINYFYPKFHLYLSNNQQHICSAQKMAFQSTTYYLISLSKDNFTRKSPDCIAKLRANPGKSQYRLYDPGENPSKTTHLETIREEYAVFIFSQSLVKNAQQKRVSIIIPQLNNGEFIKCRPLSDQDGLIKGYQSMEFKEKIIHLISVVPKLNKQRGSLTLPYNKHSKRVTRPSKRNLVVTQSSVYQQGQFNLQLSKAEKNTFNLDVCWPLSILQAFALSIANIDHNE